MDTNVTRAPGQHAVDAKLELCVSDLREALQLIRRALNTLADMHEEPETAAPPLPRVRHAMPSIGPRRPATPRVDDW